MTLKYVQPNEEVVILVNTLSDWQKDFLNNNLEFMDNDSIGSSFEGKFYNKVIYARMSSNSWHWLMVSHPTRCKKVTFNDIFIEEE